MARATIGATSFLNDTYVQEKGQKCTSCEEDGVCDTIVEREHVFNSKLSITTNTVYKYTAVYPKYVYPSVSIKKRY